MCHESVCAYVVDGCTHACQNWFCLSCKQSDTTSPAPTTTMHPMPLTTRTTSSAMCHDAVCANVLGGWTEACQNWLCLSCKQGGRKTTAPSTTTRPMPLTTRTTSSTMCHAAVCVTIVGGWAHACQNWFCLGCKQCDMTTAAPTTPTRPMALTTRTTNSALYHDAVYVNAIAVGHASQYWFCLGG